LTGSFILSNLILSYPNGLSGKRLDSDAEEATDSNLNVLSAKTRFIISLLVGVKIMAKSKTKTVYICQKCGAHSWKWQGKCMDCESWNSFVQETVLPESTHVRPKLGDNKKKQNTPLPITTIRLDAEDRFLTGIQEIDCMLGGGVVTGSLILVGGAPGIGKSTLLLQICQHVGVGGRKALYVSGEESTKQIKRRAERLNTLSDQIFLLSETSLNKILGCLDQVDPDFLVIDSIQSVYLDEIPSAPGSVSQVRECAHRLMSLAKSRNVSTILIGHVTKDGSIAGPRVLEHIVDTVLYFEGDRHHLFRILRAVKNRYGSTNEIGIFQMASAGLIEVKNPSELFISERAEQTTGSVIVCTLEGNRPLLVEIQALSSPSVYGTPQRVATGYDRNRLAILLAVLEKRQGMQLGMQDIFLNVVGGVQIDDPAADLGVICAIASSYQNRNIDPQTIVIGEVGLGGEIRGVVHVEKRLNEAAKLGFKQGIIPQRNQKDPKAQGIRIFPTQSVGEALEHTLG